MKVRGASVCVAPAGASSDYAIVRHDDYLHCW